MSAFNASTRHANYPRGVARIAVAALFLTVNSGFIAKAHATSPLATAAHEVRAVMATRKFSGNRQVAVVFRRYASGWLNAKRMEVAVGSIGNSKENRGFISWGPVWRWGRSQYGMFTEFGFSPTLIGGSQFDTADMGGVLHFTSSLAVGRRFKAPFNGEMVLRIQHISNGSIRDKNPGMDLVGLSLRLRF